MLVSILEYDFILSVLSSKNNGADGLLTTEDLAGLPKNSSNQAKMALFMVIYQLVTCLGMTLVVTLPLKALCGRERPTRITSVYRYCNMRDREHGKSMPSGDAAAAAFLMGIYLYLFGTVWPLLICLPLVSLGRVYVHCHWIGDTIVGGAMGVWICYYCYSPVFF